jgi:hypothetical protein
MRAFKSDLFEAFTRRSEAQIADAVDDRVEATATSDVAIQCLNEDRREDLTALDPEASTTSSSPRKRAFKSSRRRRFMRSVP